MAGLGMEALTFCQANSTRLAVRTALRKDTAVSGMESLTVCEFNMTRLEVGIVRKDTAEPDMESLTSY